MLNSWRRLCLQDKPSLPLDVALLPGIAHSASQHTHLRCAQPLPAQGVRRPAVCADQVCCSALAAIEWWASCPNLLNPSGNAVTGCSRPQLLALFPCSQLQATGVLCTPWPTLAHEEQMRAKYAAAQAEAAEAAAQVRQGRD